ncbi:MAG: antitoxin [Clostridia bacterium]
MGKTSSAVKKKYNVAHYDKIEFSVPKGDKEKLFETAKQLGYENLSAFIKAAIAEKTAK